MKRLVPAAIAALLACAPAEAQTFFSGLPNAPSVAAADWTLLRKASPSPGPGVGTVYQATIAQIFSPLKATGDCSGAVSAITLVLSCPGVANALPLAGGTMTGPITGASGLLPLAGGTMTGSLVLAADPSSSFQAATKSYVDTGIATVLPLAGGTLTGALILSGDPSVPLQAATKAYVDSGVGTGLPLAGGTMTGPILGASGLLPLAGGTLTGPVLSTASLASGSAALDLRGVTQATGANGVWFKDNATLAFNTAGTVQQRWNSSTQRLETLFNGGTQAWVDGNGNATFGGTVTAGTSKAGFFTTPGNTITLSGSTVPTLPANIGINWSGSSTVAGQTALANLSVSSASDGAALTGTAAAISYLLVQANTASGFQGGRFGMFAQMILNAPTTLNTAQDGFVGMGAKVIGAANAGGTATGFGVSNFGMGAMFGANPWASLHSGATFYHDVVGQEVDASIDAGASASSFAIQQLVLTSDHAVQGTSRDRGLVIAAQVGATAGLRNLMTFGDPDSQWPGDPNGYLAAAYVGQNWDTNPSTLAGGIDLTMADFTGSGPRGGGFAFRSQGFQILNSGAGQFGFGSVNGATGGLTIDTPYQQMTGTPAVAAGGTGWTTGSIAQDANGNVVRVAATAGVVTAITNVLKRGWQTSPPSNPVTFTALTRAGAQFGTGLTLNLSWTANHTLQLNPSGDTISGTGAALGTTATSGFFHLPFTNGTPTGTPANTSVPCEWNDTSKTMNCYSPGGAGWYHFTFTAGAA